MKLAVIFNGQGAQYQGMGLDFKDTYCEAEQVFSNASAVLGYDVSQLMDERFDQLTKTKYAQPAIATVSLAIFKSIEPKLPAIDYMAGLSLGEYSTLIASGSLTVSDGIALLAERGELMSSVCESLASNVSVQMMAVIGMPIEHITHIVDELDDIYVANLNSTTQTILAGTKIAIKQFNQKAKESGYRKGIPLKVEGPFHSPLMKEACDPFERILNSYSFMEGKVPVISNTTVEPHNSHCVKSTLVQHLVEPVKWRQTIEWFSSNGVTHVIQIGPGRTLEKLMKTEENAPSCLVINEVIDVQEIDNFFR